MAQFSLPELPYSKDALMPYMSMETLDFHYGKHHKGYVDNLNKLIQGTEYEGKSLEEIIKTSSGGIFNNAAQVWNHTFFWNCLTPQSNQLPGGSFMEALKKDFGSFEAFKEKFADVSIKQFGSGYGWLVKNKDGKMEIISTANAETPLTQGKTALLTCDVWEHAYYLDHRNKRPDYLAAFWKITNWKFVEENWSKS